MNQIIYELPLHENLRALIRLEYLLQIYYLQTKNLNKNSIYLALKSVDEILSIFDLNDVKKYIVDEVESLWTGILSWQGDPNVDSENMNALLEQLGAIEQRLTNSPDVLILPENNFIKNFRKRLSAPGGMSMVDFPRFNFWLNQSSQLLVDNFQDWGRIFDPYSSAIKLVLRLVREICHTTKHVAASGYFQETLDKDIEYRLIRVVMQAQSPCYAEITGGRYHVTVRMVEDDWDYGVSTYKHDKAFLLSKCRK